VSTTLHNLKHIPPEYKPVDYLKKSSSDRINGEENKKKKK
jgi:hypothetical protein